MSIALPILKTGDDPPGPAPPPAPRQVIQAGRLIDAHGRTVHDLRLSVTDRCNYRCVYCMDPDFRYMPKRQLLSYRCVYCMDPDFRYMPKRQLLSFQEYVTVARICTSLGIEKIRITGGEPTLYTELGALIAELGRLPLADLAMTTNGSL
ncbi:MAG: radical SAM protein, partial [Planctomycetota bacterium]